MGRYAALIVGLCSRGVNRVWLEFDFIGLCWLGYDVSSIREVFLCSSLLSLSFMSRTQSWRVNFIATNWASN
jgi:hypothetical protein